MIQGRFWTYIAAPDVCAAAVVLFCPRVQFIRLLPSTLVYPMVSESILINPVVVNPDVLLTAMVVSVLVIVLLSVTDVAFVWADWRLIHT